MRKIVWAGACIVVMMVMALGWHRLVGDGRFLAGTCEIVRADRAHLCTAEMWDDLRIQADSVPAITLPQARIVAGRDSVRQAEQLWQQGFEPRRDVNPWPFKLPVQWDADPFQDRNWRYQLHAWQMLDPLIVAWEKTRERKYLEDALKIVLDWQQFHVEQRESSKYGWYDMAVGLRAMKLAYLFQRAFAGDLFLSDASREKLVELAWLHGQNLMDKRYLSRGNHGLFQLHGLLALCRVLPGLTSCNGAKHFVEVEMRDLLLRQFSMEGIHLENSPSYHFFAYSTLKSFAATGWYDSFSFIRELMQRVEQNRVWLVHPDRTTVTVGDSEPKPVDIAWPAGTVGCSETVTATCFLLKNFEQSGYAIVRSDWQVPVQKSSMLFFMGMFFQNVHKLPDDLSLEWFEYGERVLTNAGKFSYNKGAFRDYVQSARAHNTVEIEGHAFLRGRDAVYGSAIREARRVGEAFLLRGEVAYGKEPVVQERRILFRPGQWLVIEDELRAEQRRKYVQWFHFAPQWQLQSKGDILTLRSTAGRTLHVLHLTAGVQVLVRGQKQPELQGWVTESYNRMTDRQSVGFAAKGDGVRLVTVLAFSDAALAEAKENFAQLPEMVRGMP